MARDHVSKEPRPARVTSARAFRWSAGRVSVVLGAVFIALAAGLLALPGGTIVGDTTTNIKISALLPGLDRDHRLVQPVEATEGRLTRVYVIFGTHPATPRCEVRAELRATAVGGAPGTGQVLATQDWSCAALPDNGPAKVLELNPIADSAGKTYDVVVTRTDDTPGPTAAVWAGPPKGTAAVAVIAGNTDNLSAAVRVEYDPQPHRWDHLVTTLNRLSSYGPDWGVPWIYVSVLALMLGLLAAGPVLLRHRRLLAVSVLVIALLRGLVWSASIPQFEAMDEPAHFAYVQFLAEQRAFPGNVKYHETYSPRLQAAVDELNVESTTPGDRPPFTKGADVVTEANLEKLSPKGGGAAPGSMYAPFYYLPAAALYLAGGDNILSQIMLARLWSVLMGVAAAGILMVLGRQLFPRGSAARWAFVVAGLCQPMIAHQFAIVNNDAWVITAGFGALSVALAMAKGRRSAKLALLAGVIIGAALLGKPFGIACAVPLVVGWIVGKVHTRERSIGVYLRESALVVLGFALTYGLWTLDAARLHLATSDVPVHKDAGQSLSGFFDAQFSNHLDSVRAIWADQLWGNFGWVRIPLLPAPLRLMVFAVEVALVLGLAAWVVVAVVGWLRHRVARPDDASAESPGGIGDSDALSLDTRILLCGVTILGTVGTLYAAGYVYYAATGANNLLQGRYALLALPAILAAPALLVERFSGGRVKPVVINSIAAFAMVSANLLGLVLVQEAFYG
jgi:hypothetical protein